jgi:hypothetical protein
MRRSLPITLALALLAALPAAAHAATPIASWGLVGQYAITDTNGAPGARCRYDSGAGSHYLGSIRSRVIAMWGNHSQLQTVGYRLLLQQRRPQGWVTVQVGPLKTALAEQDVGNGVAASKVVRDPGIAPNDARYRAALRLLWFNPRGGAVEGRVLVRIDHHRRTFDGSVRAQCRGRVPTGIGF